MEELRKGDGGRRRRGDKLNSIVFLDGIGHFEEDDDDFGSKGEERQKGPSVFFSSFLSLLPTFKWTFEILRVTAFARSVCPNRRPCDLTFCALVRRVVAFFSFFRTLSPNCRQRVEKGTGAIDQKFRYVNSSRSLIDAFVF